MSDAAVTFNPTLTAGIRIANGLNSFSTPPSIAEINGSAWMNQVIALYNRRVAQIYATPPSALAYRSGESLSAAWVNAFRAAINALRADYGLTAYSFGASAIANQKQNILLYTDLQAALNFTGPSVILEIATPWKYERFDSPFGTFVSDSNATTGLNIKCGQEGGNPNPARRRGGYSFLIPVNFNAALVATLRATVVFSVNGGGNIELYASNTDDSAGPANWWTNLNTLCSSQSAVPLSGHIDIPVPAGQITSMAGSKRSFVLGHAPEIANSNIGGSDYNEVSGCVLKIDMGF